MFMGWSNLLINFKIVFLKKNFKINNLKIKKNFHIFFDFLIFQIIIIIISNLIKLNIIFLNFEKNLLIFNICFNMFYKLKFNKFNIIE